MTRFPHHVCHGIRSEMIAADGLVVRDVEYARPVVGVVPNVAPSSSGVEAVDDGMRSSRSARDRQHLADDGSRMMAQAPDNNNNHQTRPRVPGRGYPGQELPSPHSPPHFLGVTDQGWSSRSAFPGFTRPGGCVMGEWCRVTETAIFLDKCQTRLPAGLPCCCALVCASLTLYDTGMVITVCYIRVVQTKLQQGLVASSRQRYPWPCNSFREECGGGSGQATLVLFCRWVRRARWIQWPDCLMIDMSLPFRCWSRP